MKTRKTWSIVAAWSFVFVGNLFIPGMFGLGVAGESGLPGLLMALALLWVGGWFVCVKFPRMGRCLLLGGVCTGMTQVFPVLQFGSGMIALRSLAILNSDGRELHQITLSAPSAFLVTIWTAGPLMTVALIIGYGIVAIFRNPEDLLGCQVYDPDPPSVTR